MASESSPGTDSKTREDQQLLKQWQCGNEAAFEELFHKYQTRVYSLARRLTRSDADAEDITAETFARAYISLKGISEGANVMPWLFRVAVNLCRDLGRRKTSRRTFSYDEQATVSERESLAITQPDLSQEPLERLQDSEMKQQVAAAIESLPDWQREVIVLFYLQDKSIDETAKILSTRTGTVKSRLSRAREALQSALKEYVTGSKSG